MLALEIHDLELHTTSKEICLRCQVIIPLLTGYKQIWVQQADLLGGV